MNRTFFLISGSFCLLIFLALSQFPLLHKKEKKATVLKDLVFIVTKHDMSGNFFGLISESFYLLVFHAFS